MSGLLLGALAFLSHHHCDRWYAASYAQVVAEQMIKSQKWKVVKATNGMQALEYIENAEVRAEQACAPQPLASHSLAASAGLSCLHRPFKCTDPCVACPCFDLKPPCRPCLT